MFSSHWRILSLPVLPGSLSFWDLRKGTPTYLLFPHFLIIALGIPWDAVLARGENENSRTGEGESLP